jgi:DNA modification methylase
MDPVRVRRRSADGTTEIVAAESGCNSIRSQETSRAAMLGSASLELKLEYRPIGDLRPSPRNARTHSKKQLAKMAASIRRFGFIVPLLVDDEGFVVAGHGRLEAAKEVGHATLPVICLSHLTAEERRAYAIADNRLAELAGWDNEVLAVELTALLEIESFEIELTGFETASIDTILGNADDAAEDPGDLVPAGPQAVTRLGDLWRLGEHRLLCGDARDSASLERLLVGQKAQMVFTDPPYNVQIAKVSGLGKVKHREFAMASGEMTSAAFTEFLKKVLGNLAASSIDGSIHYVCMDWRHMAEVMAAGAEVYAEMKNLCVWAKDNGGMGSFYRSQHELVFVYKNGTAPHLNNFGLGEAGRYRTNLWSYAGLNTIKRGRTEELAMHPTVKPVAMVADAIKDCSKRGGIILDAFGGAGTTLIAAEKTGRRGYLLELDPLYIDVAIRRWQKATGKRACRDGDGALFDEVVAAGLGEGEVRHG